MATPPRIILPGKTIHLILNALNQQFRFVPTPEAVASIRYIFWYYVGKYGISVHDHCWMSNHAHFVLTDERGVLPNFMTSMNALISRQLNALWKSKGSNFEKGYADIEILDDERIVETCAYVLANPCSAHLSATAKEWRGVSSAHLQYGENFSIERPKCGLWEPATNDNDGARRRETLSKLPEVVHGSLTRPKIHSALSDEEIRAKVFKETRALEEKAAAERKLENKGIVPWENVQSRKPNDLPREVRSGSSRRPRVDTNCPKKRALALKKIRAFANQYSTALNHFINKKYHLAIFPAGTWKMRIRFQVKCDPPAAAACTC